MIQIREIDNQIELNVPKREMKYILIWCSNGSISMMVDEKELVLNAHDVLTITSGQYHYYKALNQAQGFILEFTLDYFCKDDTDIELIFQNGLFCHFDMNEVIRVQNDDMVNENLKLISDELTSQPYQYLITTHSRIELILVEINRSKINRGDEIWKPEALFLKFLEAVRANFQFNYSLGELAQRLNTTELKLNELARVHAGKTAQNVIYGLIVSEAKRLLTYENLTVKEVAFQLGFQDPFYFSKFFKKHTSQSPKRYQAQFAI